MVPKPEPARFSISCACRIGLRKRLFVYKDPKDVEHRLAGIRKAGRPER